MFADNGCQKWNEELNLLDFKYGKSSHIVTLKLGYLKKT
jgi:hypothetical protein